MVRLDVSIKQDIFEAIIGIGVRFSGIQAVVLGGSRARGTHFPESDIDIGIYYDKQTLDEDSGHSPLVDCPDILMQKISEFII